MAIVKAIVNDGVSVINSAASRSATVTLVDCLSSTHWDSSQSELVSKPVYWYNGPRGQITGVSTGEGSLLKVRVEFESSLNQTPLKSFCLRVIASDAENDLPHYLYVYSDGNSAITLKEFAILTFEIPINVSPDVIVSTGSVVDDSVQDAIDSGVDEAKGYTDSEIQNLENTIGSTYFNSASIENNVLSLSRPDGSSVEIDLS